MDGRKQPKSKIFIWSPKGLTRLENQNAGRSHRLAIGIPRGVSLLFPYARPDAAGNRNFVKRLWPGVNKSGGGNPGMSAGCQRYQGEQPPPLFIPLMASRLAFSSASDSACLKLWLAQKPEAVAFLP